MNILSNRKMLNKLKKAVLLTGTLSIALYSFQNCSKVNFTQEADYYSKLSGPNFFTASEDTLFHGQLDYDAIRSNFEIQGSKTFSVALSNNPLNGSISNFDPSTGSFDYQPKLNFFGEDVFVYQITVLDKGRKFFASEKAFIDVKPINDGPSIANANYSTSQNSSLDFVSLATDIDSKNLQFSFSSFSQNGSITDKGKGTFTYLPRCGFSGVETVSVLVTDEGGLTASAQLTFTVNSDSAGINVTRVVDEDTILNDRFDSLVSRCSSAGTTNLAKIQDPAHGTISNINSSNLSYSYLPTANFNGIDSFKFNLTASGITKTLTVNVTVKSINDLPSITTKTFEVYKNNQLTFHLEITDPDILPANIDTRISTILGASRPNSIPTARGGTLFLTGTNTLKYIPKRDLYGIMDSAQIILVDDANTETRFTLNFNLVFNPISFLQPALAVRGVSCTMCHATVHSAVISDFGHGDEFAKKTHYRNIYGSEDTMMNPYLGTDPLNIAKTGTIDFSVPTYEVLTSINSIWETARLYGTLFVPNKTSEFGQNFKTYFNSLSKDRFYNLAVQQMTNSELFMGTLHGSSAITGAPFNNVSTKENIFIGAPTEQDLKMVMTNPNAEIEVQVGSSLANISSALGVSGGKYFFNNGTISCEGDIIIKGTLLLNNATVNTNSGCRLYIIGSVFIQNNLNIPAITSLSNVQISSTKAILLGVGEEAFNLRKNSYSLSVRGFPGSALLNLVSSERSNIAGLLKDAINHNNRNISFSRLLLNAPQVHSRYIGNFTGVIIAEIAVMAPGNFAFTFDPLYSNQSVDILPLLNGKKILSAD